MNSSSSQILLKGTSTMSLHDRFTFVLQNKQQFLSDIGGTAPQLQAASLENQLLAQQLARRPSVMAALQNNSSLKERLGQRTIMARLGRPAIRRGLRGVARYWGRPRGRGAHFRGGLQQRNMKMQVSDVAECGGLIQQSFVGSISREGLMHNRGVRRPQRGRGFGWVGRRGRAESRPCLTREELDKQLDDYMSMSKSHLDAQLDEYMAEVDSEAFL